MNNHDRNIAAQVQASRRQRAREDRFGIIGVSRYRSTVSTTFTVTPRIPNHVVSFLLPVAADRSANDSGSLRRAG